MRVGLVGVGRIGVLHAETLAGNPEVTRLIVADVDGGRARQVADKLGAEAAGVDQVFDGRADAVVVAAATSAHAELVHRAVDAALPVFCEKPLAADVTGTRRVIAHAGAAGVPLQLGFQRRFDAGYRAARQAVQEGRLGFVHSLYATTFDPAPPHPDYIAVSGGIFRDCFIHDFDILRFVTGREAVSVSAYGANKGAAFFTAAGDVDTATVSLLLDDGTVATVLGSRYNGAGYDVRLEVHGSEGTVVVGLEERVPLRSAEPAVTWPEGRPYTSFFERFHAAYATELGEFVACALGRGASPCPPEDGLEALYIAEAATLSWRQGRQVRLDEVRG